MTRKVHLRVNWDTVVTETPEFKTTVFTSSNGREQRSAERLSPRRTINFGTLLNKNALRNAQNLHNLIGTESLMIADPTRRAAVLTSSVADGATVLPIDFLPDWLTAGIDIAVVEPTRTVFTSVASTSAGSLTLVSGLSKAISVGASIQPAIIVTPAHKASFSASTDTLATHSATFNQVAGSLLPELGSPALPVFESRPVLAVGPNWSRALVSSFETAVDTVDYERGIWKDYLRHDIVSRISQFDYLGRSADTIGQVVSLFNDCRGRQGEVWCPTWMEDMVPTTGITIGQTEITVEGRYLADFYAGSKTHKAIAIRLSNGEWIYRRVTDILVNGLNPGEFTNDFSDDFRNGESIIQIDEPFATNVELPEDFSEIHFATPMDVNAERLEIVGVHWLHLCRFANDQLSIQWITNDVAQLVANIQTLEYFAPEDL